MELGERYLFLKLKNKARKVILPGTASSCQNPIIKSHLFIFTLFADECEENKYILFYIFIYVGSDWDGMYYYSIKDILTNKF